MVRRCLPCLVVAGLSFAYFLTYPLAIGRADESHLLYGAKRVLQGQVIYRDFFEILTPLSYYLFAGIYRVAGTTLRAARVGIAVIEAVGCAALFHLARRVASALEATLAVALFTCICIPTWPYASPHWISTTLALLVAAVLLAVRWQRSVRARPLVAGVLAGAALCVQQQRGVFLAAWVPLALFVLSFSLPSPGRWRTLGREVAWAAGAGAAVVLGVLGYAAWASSLTSIVDMLYRLPVNNYASVVSRVNRWAAELPLTGIFRTAAWQPVLLRVSPLFVVCEGALLLLGARCPQPRSGLERACLVLLAALMMLSVWYLPDFIHVSFILPFLLIPGASLLHRLRVVPLWDRVPAGRHALTVGVALLSLAVVGQGAANVVSAYERAPERLATAFGALRVDADSARVFRAVRTHLVREPDGRTLLYSYPDDAWLYLALPADDATRYSVLLPKMFPAEDIEEAAAVLRARRPGTVLVVPFQMGPVGTALEGGYDVVEEVGPYRIFVRREAPVSGAGG